MVVDVQAYQAAVEAACEQFKHPATQAQAEQVLLQFRSAPGSLPACRHILDHSGSVDARFHAACALREGLLREWSTHSEQERCQLRSYVLQYVMLHAAEGQLGVVRSILHGALGVMLKRGWLEGPGEGRAAFFQELDACSQAVGSAAARMASLQVLEAVVGEFSLVTASQLGLSWEFHVTCRNQLEESFLRLIFEHALAAAQSAAEACLASHGRDDGSASVLAAAMALMAAVLGWDFRATSNSFVSASAALTAAMAGRKGLPDSSQVKPGAAWGELLLAPATTGWLAHLVPALSTPAEAPGALAAAARQLVVSFCSLAGDVFPKPAVAGAGAASGGGAAAAAAAPATVAHVSQMLRLVLPWCVPAQQQLQQALAGDEGQLVDACRALAALCASHKVGVLEAASTALQQQQQQHHHHHQQQQAAVGGLFAAIEALTCSCLAAGGVSPASSPEPWLPDCTDMLLECWSGLLAPQCGYAMAVLPPPPSAAQAAARTASRLVEAALADAAAGAHEDADDDADAGAGAVHQEEWMARAAVLLRAAPVTSFNQLADHMAAARAQLAAAAAAGVDPSEPLEQLHWLARMAAAALADSGQGEVPLPPEAVLLAVGDTGLGNPGCGGGGDAQAAAAGAAAVERLSRSLLELAAGCLSREAAGLLSPRLLEGVLWGCSRWADTYLFPEEEALPEALEGAFGGEAGHGVLDMLAHVGQHCLAHFPGEVELHRQVCHVLLPCLVRRKTLTRRLLVLPSWQALAAAFSRREAGLTTALPQKLQRSLSRSLCLAASGFADDAAAQQYVSQLLLATANEVAGLAAQQQLAASAQRADVQLQVCCMLEVLRGAAAGTLAPTFPSLHTMFSGLLSPLLVLHGAFKHVPPVVALLLKLADDIVEHLGVFLEAPQHKQALLSWTLALLTQYRDSNRWQVSLQTAASLKEERAAEQCRDLRALLNLLIHVTQSDLPGGDDDDNGKGAAAANGHGSSGEGDAAGAARVVLLGLHIVLPLISAELLKFPKLARLYYSLLAYMLEVYPRAVAELPAAHFGSLMASLEWGLLGSEPVAMHCSLEGLAGLARFQLASVRAGAQGLAAQSAGARSVVGHFQELLLRRLLLDDTPQDLVELAGDALLPLLLAEPSAFAPLSAAMAAAAGAGGDARAPAAVSGALMQLGAWLQAHADQLAAVPPAAHVADSSMMRGAARQFRQQLCKMVADVRGLIRMR